MVNTIFIVGIICINIALGATVGIVYFAPSTLNGHFGYSGIPEGVTSVEAGELKDIQDECFEWNSSWTGDLKTGHCDFDDKVIKPIGFWEDCGDYGYMGQYECRSGSDGCTEGYVLVKDHWGRHMCYEQSHYNETLTFCSDKYGEFWESEFTTGGFSCHKMSDSEILEILIQERSESND